MTDASDRTRYRLLHAMIRVKDLEKSLDFYTRHLGMRLLRRREFPDVRRDNQAETSASIRMRRGKAAARNGGRA